MKNFLLVAITVILLIMAISSTTSSNIRNKNKLTGIDKTFIDDPIQIAVNSESEIMNINGIDIEIKKRYSYEITGRVVKTYEYKEYYVGNETYNTIASKDVGMVWGNLVKDENVEKIEFSMPGSRSLRYSITDGKWVNQMGGISNICSKISNNHLITNDDEILDAIAEIKEGDFIRISGYLINASGGNIILNSSVSRDDTGNHACEVILVEDIKWLE